MSQCDECETPSSALYYCGSCDQSLCESCDRNIHNKAKRKSHSRSRISAPTETKVHAICQNSPNFSTKPSLLANGMVFCLSIGAAFREDLREYQQNLTNFLLFHLQNSQSSKLYLLIWNVGNEKINKMLLEIQYFLQKHTVMVFSMKVLEDFAQFFFDFAKELDKFAEIHVIISHSLYSGLQSLLPSSAKYVFKLFDARSLEFSRNSQELTAKKSPILSKTHDFLKTCEKIPRKEQFLASFFSFPDYQPYKTLHFSAFPSKLSLFLQDFLRSRAKSGLLMLEKSAFFSEVSSEILNSSLCSAHELPYLLAEAENQQLFHTTIRKFDDEANVFPFISLHLDELSLESLCWVLRSLQKDEMTPTEKVILSRIKETFSLKLSINDWLQVLAALRSRMDQNSIIYSKNKDLPPLRLEISQETALFFAWEKWICSDRAELSAFDREDWHEFLDFLRNYYFRAAQPAKIAYKSVQNRLEKAEGRKKYASFQKKSSKNNNWIPGGKYGCCQFIKCCGTPRLQQISFGKLHLFVQEALDRGLLEYNKTNLIDTEALKMQKIPENSNKFEEKNPVFEKKLAEVRGIVWKILYSFPYGVNLARLPKMIQFSMGLPFDCQELGCKKLKDLLNKFEEVELIEMGDNVVAKLREFARKYAGFLQEKREYEKIGE